MKSKSIKSENSIQCSLSHWFFPFLSFDVIDLNQEAENRKICTDLINRLGLKAFCPYPLLYALLSVINKIIYKQFCQLIAIYKSDFVVMFCFGVTLTDIKNYPIFMAINYHMVLLKSAIFIITTISIVNVCVQYNCSHVLLQIVYRINCCLWVPSVIDLSLNMSSELPWAMRLF